MWFPRRKTRASFTDDFAIATNSGMKVNATGKRGSQTIAQLPCHGCQAPVIMDEWRAGHQTLRYNPDTAFLFRSGDQLAYGWLMQPCCRACRMPEPDCEAALPNHWPNQRQVTADGCGEVPDVLVPVMYPGEELRVYVTRM